MPEMEEQNVKPLLAQFADERANLIPILQEIQATFSYLPQ